jgi:hypothetical protein
VANTGALSAEVYNSGTTRNVAGPTITLDQWVLIGVHIDDAAGRAAFRVDDTTTVTTFTATPAVSRYIPSDTRVEVQSYSKIAEVQLRVACGESGIWPDTTWTADFELDRLQNRDLAGIFPPDEPQEAWDLLQELVAPERGLVWLDYDGRLRVWSRARLNASDSLTVQRTLTTHADIWALGYDDSRVMVRNVVRVPYQEIAGSQTTALWTLTSVVSIAAGETQTWNLTFPPHGGGEVYFVGSWQQFSDGSGEGGSFDSAGPFDADLYVVSLTITSATTATVVLKAGAQAYTKYFVDSGGIPDAALVGTPMTRLDSRLQYEARSPDSIEPFGELPLQVSSNPWRQSINWAKGEAHQLLALLAQPQVVFTSIGAPLDPRLEPFDRFVAQDEHGLHLDRELIVEALTDVLAPGQADMELVGREAREQWLLGASGVGTPVGTTMLGGEPE